MTIGNFDRVKLLDFVDALEEAVEQKAIRHYMEVQKGDVPATLADAALLQQLTDYRPHPEVRDGIERLLSWSSGYCGK